MAENEEPTDTERAVAAIDARIAEIIKLSVSGTVTLPTATLVNVLTGCREYIEGMQDDIDFLEENHGNVHP